ncbi:MAG: DNA polymerase III subunit delta, partial [Halioglobus sp.]|nr:DNA polymerase III subunit delta [Halioglobus sp.]
MRLYAEKLHRHLEQQLLPVYLVSGDEPLLVQECCDQIRAHVRASGFDERNILDASQQGFDWREIMHSAACPSLFAERRLTELRLPSGKPGKEGSRALCDYLATASAEDVLLIVSGKIDKQSTNSKWYKALDKAGAT